MEDIPNYMTRAEGAEIRREQQITNERLAIVEHEQQGQKTTLAEMPSETGQPTSWIPYGQTRGAD